MRFQRVNNDSHVLLLTVLVSISKRAITYTRVYACTFLTGQLILRCTFFMVVCNASCKLRNIKYLNGDDLCNLQKNPLFVQTVICLVVCK